MWLFNVKIEAPRALERPKIRLPSNSPKVSPRPLPPLWRPENAPPRRIDARPRPVVSLGRASAAAGVFQSHIAGHRRAPKPPHVTRNGIHPCIASHSLRILSYTRYMILPIYSISTYTYCMTVLSDGLFAYTYCLGIQSDRKMTHTVCVSHFSTFIFTHTLCLSRLSDRFYIRT